MIEHFQPASFRSHTWIPNGTLKTRQVRSSLLHTLFRGLLSYRANKPSEARLNVCKMLHDLTEKVMGFGPEECNENTKEQYIEQFIAYLAATFKKDAIAIFVAEEFDLPTHATTEHVLAGAAAVGNLAAVEAILSTHESAREHLKALLYPEGDYRSKATLARDPIIAAAVNGNTVVLEYLLHFFNDLRDQMKDARFHWYNQPEPISTALRAAVAAGQIHTAAILAAEYAECYSRYGSIDPREAESLLVALARSGNKDLLSLVLNVTQKSEVSKKTLKIACRHGSTELIRHIVHQGHYTKTSCRGLLRYAVKSRSYAAAKAILELGFTSNNDGLVNLTIKNNDPHMLKLLLHHGTKVTYTHALRAEQSLAQIGYKSATLEFLLAMKEVRWMEQTDWHDWAWFSHLEYATSCDRRKQKVLTMYLVYRAAQVTEPTKNWKWFTPLLFKLHREIMEDGFWGKEAKRLTEGVHGVEG
jgi:hypothetical protein